MNFSSLTFAAFFVVVFTTYWLLPTRRSRHILLLLASYLFYMSWNAWLITLILASTIMDYFVGLGLDHIQSSRRRKLLISASVCGNLGMLAVFKYADFFIVSLQELLTTFGFPGNLHTLNILLPAGISFYTFQTMSYTIDVYRRDTPAECSFIDFALFVAFFPQLVAGPIVVARDFLPQLAEKKRFQWARMDSAAVLFLVGLTKKLLIADQLGPLADAVFADPTRYATRDLWLGMFCYGGQIYCDFSGYSDMAIALARVFGFELRINFANPYLATSMSDFWRRWHISLSTWLRDYLYIPLGGSRRGRLLTHRNLMITMLLGGLWHGASWTFVIWGAIHGAALALSKAWAGWRSHQLRIADCGLRIPGSAACDPIRNPKFEIRNSSSIRNPQFFPTLVAWAATLLTVHLAWVFFRCQPMLLNGGTEREPTIAALHRAVYFIHHLFVPAPVANPVWLMNKVPCLLLLALMGAMQLYNEWVRRGRPRILLPAPIAGPAYAAWILILVIFSPEKSDPFIYFQF